MSTTWALLIVSLNLHARVPTTNASSLCSGTLASKEVRELLSARDVLIEKPLSNQVVLVWSTRQQSWSMNDLASLLHCTYDESKKRLYRSRSEVRELQKEQAEAWLDVWRQFSHEQNLQLARYEDTEAFIKKLWDQLQSGLPQKADQVAEYPAHLLLRRALVTLSTSGRLSLFDASRKTFCTKPNAYEMPIGPEAGSALENFLKQQNLLRNFIRSAGSPPNVTNPYWRTQVLAGLNEDEVTDKVVILASRLGSNIVSVLYAYNREGAKIADASWTVKINTPEGVDFPKDWFGKLANKKHQLSRKATEIEGLFEGDPTIFLPMRDRQPSDKKLQTSSEEVLNPEVTDPLSLGVGESLVALATALGASSAMGIIPDRAYLAFRAASNEGEVDLLLFAKELAKQGLNMSLEDERLTFAPRDTLGSEADRLSRTDLQKFLRSVWSQSEISLREYCRYRYRVGDVSSRNAVDGLYRSMLIATGHAFPDWTSMPPVCYRLIGSLDDASFRMLSQGRPLNLSGLSQDQANLARTWVLTSTGERQLNAPDIVCVGAEALGREGLSGTLRLTLEALPMIMRAKDSGAGASSLQVATTPLSVVELAESFVNIRSQELASSIEALMDGRYVIGAREKWEVDMRLSAGATWHSEATGPIHLGTLSYRWPELPKDFRERFGREVAALDAEPSPR